MTDWLTLTTALFLAIALSAYVLFGGADFGGGILEAVLPPPLRKKLQATLGPIWEANHVWLIAVIVILFVGFPKFYTTLMTRLYVPISLALLMVLVRGTFFTLRKYDPRPDDYAALYSFLFRASSALAPLFFGFVVGGLLTEHPGGPTELPTALSFRALYITPWLHPFGFLVGVFVLSLFGYLAAVFFAGELEDVAERSLVARRAFAFFLSTFFCGGLVLFGGAVTARIELYQALDPIFIMSQTIAAASTALVFTALTRHRIWLARFAAGAQTFAILAGFLSTQYPALLRTTQGPLTLADSRAPAVTQTWLLIGLVGVLALVIPLLVVLYRVFQSKPPHANDRA